MKVFLPFAPLVFSLALAGCGGPVQISAPPQPAALSQPLGVSDNAVQTFAQVVRTVEPVAENECRARTSGMNCNFLIVVDDRPDQPPNAFQTLDSSGRPVVAFTLALIADARNADELAFVLGHETAHHIAGHMGRQQQNAVAGAVIFAGLATLSGGDASAVETAQRVGAQRSTL
mgnify:CR=1 FL=1